MHFGFIGAMKGTGHRDGDYIWVDSGLRVIWVLSGFKARARPFRASRPVLWARHGFKVWDLRFTA